MFVFIHIYIYIHIYYIHIHICIYSHTHIYIYMFHSGETLLLVYKVYPESLNFLFKPMFNFLYKGQIH